MLNEFEKAGVVREDCSSPDFCAAKIVELIRPLGSPCGPAEAVQNWRFVAAADFFKFVMADSKKMPGLSQAYGTNLESSL